MLSVGLVLADHRHHIKPVRQAMMTVVAPLQYLVNWPFHLVALLSENITTKESLLASNLDLRAKFLLLKAREQKLIALEKENKQLRALLDSSPETGERLRIAQLLAVDSDPFIQEIVIDQGAAAGVYVGQPVLDASGVMGQVMVVGALTSRVLLLTDTRSAIPVVNYRNGIRGIAVGTGIMGNLRLQYVTDTTDVAVDDRFVTSRLGLRFPVGFPVGVVKSVEKKSGDQFLEVLVIPAAQLARSHQVLLVWPNDPETAEATKKEIPAISAGALGNGRG